MVNICRPVVNRFLNEQIFRLIRYGYFAIYKRPDLTCAEELEELKNAIVNEMEPDEAVKEEKYLLRAGHGGNLDSMATGVLAIALCDGCKILPSLIESSKRYTVTAQLGVATDTLNNKGRVVEETPYEHVTRPMLEQALTEFIGEIWQKPPAYSALKIHGKRASDIVSSGEEVNLTPRPVMCHTARCVEFQPPYFTLDVSCGRGFYIRSLVSDLSQALVTSAHVTALVRTKHGPFTVKDCLHPEHYSLDNIVSAVTETRTKHPKLAKHLEDYWREHKSKNKVHKQKTSPLNQEQGIEKHKSDTNAFQPSHFKRRFRPI